MFIASLEGHLEVVRLLIEAGADKDKANDDGTTPLYVASINGHLEVVRLLVEKGADKDKANNRGVTPLQIARRRHNYNIAIEITMLQRAGVTG